MAQKNCYICSNETNVSSGFLNANKIAICDNCESDIASFQSSLKNYSEKMEKKVLGLRLFSNQIINRCLIEAKRRIQSDETIIDFIFGLSAGAMASLGGIYGMSILTNKRLIQFIPKGDALMGCIYEYSVPLEEIIEVVIEVASNGHNLSVRDKGSSAKTNTNIKIINCDEVYIQSFLMNFGSLKKEITQQNNTPSQSPSDNIEKIKKLKELLDLGIINNEEFESKKKDLLNTL
jgi:hypothetical protein